MYTLTRTLRWLVLIGAYLRSQRLGKAFPRKEPVKEQDVMHQETHGIGIGDSVEFVAANLPETIIKVWADLLREYDGSGGRVVGLFSDSQGVKCATVEIKSEFKKRSGKRYLPLAALVKK